MSLLLVFVLVFQMVPTTAFADNFIIAEGSAPTMEERPDPMDSIYYQGVSAEYTASDVLWEIEEKRTETEKHFRLANGSDIAVAYTFPVHYEDERGELQEIDNSLQLYNADGTLSTEPVESGLTAEVSLDTSLISALLEGTELDAAETVTVSPEPSPISTPDPEPSADEVLPEQEDSAEDADEADSPEIALDTYVTPASIDAQGEADPEAESLVSVDDESEPSVEPTDEVSDEADQLETVEPAPTEIPEAEASVEPVLPEPTQTPEPQASVDEAQLQELDLSSVLESLPIDTRVYRNNAGLAQVQLAVSAGAGQLASISYGDYTVSLTPRISVPQRSVSAIADQAIGLASVAGRVQTVEPVVDEDSFAARVLPDNLSASLVYDGILNGSDLEYVIGETSLKENIIVNEPADSYVYKFTLETGGLTPTLTQTGSIELKAASGDIIFVIPAGYMIDADGVGSMDIEYALEPVSSSEYILTVTADAEWMNDAGRAFPVTIDPPVYLQGFYNIETGTIFQYYPDAMGGQRATEALGYYSANNGYCHTLVRVNSLPTIPDNSYVVNSGIYLYEVAYDHVGMNPMRVQAQALEWNYPTEGYWCLYHSWNDTPDPLPEVLDFTDVYNARNFYGWNITKEVIKWYNNPNTNYGISLQATKEGSMTYASCANVGFASSNTSNDAARPFFVVEYRNNVGLESYYTYQTQSIGRAGTGYVGDYSGQLTLVKNDISHAGTVNPVSINHVYNSSYSGGDYCEAVNGAGGKYSSFSLGKGWMLDFMQIIVPTEDGYLMYVDGDGTAHYFYPSDSVYKDEDGLGLTITVSGTNYTLKDKKDNISYFSGGTLRYMQDANGNRINYNLDNDGVPVSVTRQNNGGSLETIATLSYDMVGYLYQITDSANNTTTFDYDYQTGHLTQITHPDGTTVTYTYGADGKLASATDNESGYAMNYEYNGNTGKVNLFYEESPDSVGARVQADGSFSGVQSYRYSGLDRILGNDDDIISHNIQDYFGRTTSSYTTNASENLIYGANSTAYSLNSGVSATNNRALISTATGTQSVNLLGYPSIEGTSNMSATPWSFSGGGSGAINFARPRTGTRSMYISRTAGNADSLFSQTLTGLDPNRWYVLSGYVNTASVTSFGSVTMMASGAETSVVGTSVNWNTAGVGDGWERIYVTAQPSSSGQLTLTVKVSGIVGGVFLDDFQAELSLFDERGTPGSASLLQNGSMRSNSTWATWTSARVGYVSDTTFGKVLFLNGDSFESVDVYQDVFLVQPGTQTYILSGWAKASAVPLEGSGHRSFSLWVELYYGDEDGTSETHSIECNADSEEWQFVSLPIVPKHPELTVNAIRVYLTFCRNPNTARFANISLTREEAQSYKYNADGELISVTSSENEPQTFSYSGADLISQVTQGNGTLTYEYDAKHNVTKATNDGLSMATTYDGKGNTTGTTLTGTGSGSQINSSAAYDANGNLLTSQTDARGKTVSYSYDNAISKQTGQPTTVTDANDVETYNFYNTSNGRIESVGTGYSPYINYSYANGQLSAMERTAYVPSLDADVTQTYTMGYDSFGRMSSVNVGNRNLACYSYDSCNGNLNELYYGTGEAITYEYDALERISNVYYNDDIQTPAVSYSYSSNGALSRMDDYASGRDYVYNYDALGRLTSMTERYGSYGVQSYRSSFDGANRVSSVNYRVSPAWNGTFRDARTYSYTYDSGNGSLTGMGLPANGSYTYSYDALQRLTGRTLKLSGSNFLTRSYSFVPGTGANGTTMMVASMSTTKGNGSSLNSYTYSYDDVGNITAISGSTSASYTYDVLGQMLTETYGGKTYSYDYDEAGNIRSVSDGTTTHSYSYGDAQWKDLLTAYDGQSISYDAIGNPTAWYDGTAFTWALGRRLTSAVNSGTGLDNSYTYDSNGLRLTKTIGDIEHKYVWQGGRLVSENWAGQELEFFYDESGSPYAFSYKSSATATPVMYYYVTNLQGDVVNILNASGSTVASYSYNAWGKVLTATGTMAAVNPLRYRGYYYDTDTGLYYLQSRYYDPEICRFINADALVNQSSVLGYNLFAYCCNNPVSMTDTAGNLPFFAITAAIGAVVGAVVGGIVAAKNDGNIWAGIGIGAAAGALIGTGAGIAASAALAGSIVATTGAVAAGGSTLIATATTGGLGAGATYIANNLSQAANNLAPAAQTAASKMQVVATKGKTGEALSGLTKNTTHIPSLTGTASYRIPDGLNASTKILSEVKNYSGTLSYTNQLKDFVMWSQTNGYQMHLYTNATLTGPLQRVVDSGIIQLFPLG